jgi:hypothetical protein
MERHILDAIPYVVDVEALAERVRLRERHRPALLDIVERAEAIARPKAIYGMAFIDERDAEALVIDGVTFKSRVLRVNLDDTGRVFPYAVTCGTELESWHASVDDIVEQYWIEAIMEQALGEAIGATMEAIDGVFSPGKTASMGPGSLLDWPLREQRPLFELLGDTEASIGLRLTPSFLMLPAKSVSGIRFPTEHGFATCMLCPREGCPNRRAPHDPELYQRRYAPDAMLAE